MHQSGHWRAQSMQTVQLSSTREITPRDRAVMSSFTWGYCTVTAPCNIVMKVVFRPFTIPRGVLTARSTDSGSSGMDGHLRDTGDEDVRQRQRDQELPGEALQLVLPEAGQGEADPEDHKAEEHDLGEHHAAT